MREARFIVPVDEKTYTDVSLLVSKLVDLTGGVTDTSGSGMWKNPKTSQVEIETVRIIDVAYDQNYVNDCVLYKLAQEFRKNANQQEVYLRYGNGHVQFVSEKSVAMDNGESMPTGDLEVPEFVNLLDATERFVNEHTTSGERIAAIEYIVRSLTKGNKGHHDNYITGKLTKHDHLSRA